MVRSNETETNKLEAGNEQSQIRALGIENQYLHEEREACKRQKDKSGR